MPLALIDAVSWPAQARTMRFAFVVVLAASCLGACASPPPFGCTTAAVDGSGRGIPVCSAADHVPVCDAAGEMAHFTGPSTSTLEGGSLALCDSSNEIVCPDPSTLPRCISRPPMEP